MDTAVVCGLTTKNEWWVGGGKKGREKGRRERRKGREGGEEEARERGRSRENRQNAAQQKWLADLVTPRSVSISEFPRWCKS